jgi:hypothetical protein
VTRERQRDLGDHRAGSFSDGSTSFSMAVMRASIPSMMRLSINDAMMAQPKNPVDTPSAIHNMTFDPF